MNSGFQYDLLSDNLDGLRARMPEVPQTTILLVRLLQFLARGTSLMLEDFIRPAGLNDAEFRVLTTLFSQPEGIAHPTDLCAKTAQSPANMSRISDALVSRDLITRVASLQDRRKLVLRITEPGEELVRQLLPSMWVPLREMFKDFSDDDQRLLTAQLRLLSQRLDEGLSHRSAERD